jgi:acetolactate synthase-1/2/3 large subunit
METILQRMPADVMAKNSKLSDYVAEFVAKNVAADVFLITGGGSMHLNDSFGTNKHIRYWCCHHEQACAIAAEVYARFKGFACVNPTTGPGGTNTITGLIGAWLDSIPVLYISGNVRKPHIGAGKRGLRQIGIQELNIVNVVKPVTKYAVFVADPRRIRYELEKACYIARSGRPGPVWLDIPLDVQSALINEKHLKGFPLPKEPEFDTNKVLRQMKSVVKLLQSAKRPVIIAGGGIRLAHGEKELLLLIKKLGIPVVTGMSAHDLIPSNHPLYFGRPGPFGERVGNLVVQNSDLVIAIGSRLHLWDIGLSPELWARKAKKIVVDIDAAELKKPTIHPDLAIRCDAKFFINKLLRLPKLPSLLKREDLKEWITYCQRIRRQYSVFLPGYAKQKKYVNSYYFTKVLSEELHPGEIVITANGTAFTGTRQSFIVKKNQRFISNIGCASMGYDLPGAIGAAVATEGKKRIICIAGDGSIQMNLQELQTIVHNKFPIIIFVLNNEGYLAIRNTQDHYFKSRYIGADARHGVSCPDICKIAKAYGIPALRISNQKNLRRNIKKILRMKGPVICDIMMDPKQPLIPKPSSVIRPDGSMQSMPLEDMYPFVTRNEFKKNMIIPPIDESI